MWSLHLPPDRGAVPRWTWCYCGCAATTAAESEVVLSKSILNLADVEFAREMRHGNRFDAKVAPISTHLGAKRLAYNVTVVAPGKRAFPLHNHHTNEELLLILAGTGTLRFGREEHPVREGYLIACPPGGPEVAHQLVKPAAMSCATWR